MLITGRQLEHWHTGSMTRRTAVLDAIEPAPVASLNSDDSEALGVAPGGTITVASRRGAITLSARADDGTPRGAVFIPFCYYEAAANLLTNPALDPFGKIPEFKYCAVRVTAGGVDSRGAGLRHEGAIELRKERPRRNSALGATQDASILAAKPRDHVRDERPEQHHQREAGDAADESVRKEHRHVALRDQHRLPERVLGAVPQHQRQH